MSNLIVFKGIQVVKIFYIPRNKIPIDQHESKKRNILQFFFIDHGLHLPH